MEASKKKQFKMEAPKKKEIKWKKMKLAENGAKGIEIKYGYLRDVDGHIFPVNITHDDGLIPHDDFIELIKQLKSIVAKVENYDYARKLLYVDDFNATPFQQTATETAVQQHMEMIEPTGISITEKGLGEKTEEHIIITYKKYDEKDRCKGTCTGSINLKDYEYEIEDDLKEIIDDLKNEAFSYVFEGKYATPEQLSLLDPEYQKSEKDKSKEKEKVEEAKIVD